MHVLSTPPAFILSQDQTLRIFPFQALYINGYLLHPSLSPRQSPSNFTTPPASQPVPSLRPQALSVLCVNACSYHSSIVNVLSALQFITAFLQQFHCIFTTPASTPDCLRLRRFCLPLQRFCSPAFCGRNSVVYTTQPSLSNPFFGVRYYFLLPAYSNYLTHCVRTSKPITPLPKPQIRSWRNP